MHLRPLTAATLALTALLGCAPEAPPPGPEETTLTRAGQVAPGFEVTTLEGETLTLESLSGRVVVLSFFATWCPPCREEIPHLEAEVWRAYREQGVVVVGLAREEDAEVLEPFVEAQGITYPVAPDPDRRVFARYAERYIPRTVVVDPEGIIVYQSSGFESEEFERMVAAVRSAAVDAVSGDRAEAAGAAPSGDAAS